MPQDATTLPPEDDRTLDTVVITGVRLDALQAFTNIMVEQYPAYIDSPVGFGDAVLFSLRERADLFEPGPVRDDFNRIIIALEDGLEASPILEQSLYEFAGRAHSITNPLLRETIGLAGYRTAQYADATPSSMDAADTIKIMAQSLTEVIVERTRDPNAALNTYTLDLTSISTNGTPLTVTFTDPKPEDLRQFIADVLTNPTAANLQARVNAFPGAETKLDGAVIPNTDIAANIDESKIFPNIGTLRTAVNNAIAGNSGNYTGEELFERLRTTEGLFGDPLMQARFFADLDKPEMADFKAAFITAAENNPSFIAMMSLQAAGHPDPATFPPYMQAFTFDENPELGAMREALAQNGVVIPDDFAALDRDRRLNYLTNVLGRGDIDWAEILEYQTRFGVLPNFNDPNIDDSRLNRSMRNFRTAHVAANGEFIRALGYQGEDVAEWWDSMFASMTNSNDPMIAGIGVLLRELPKAWIDGFAMIFQLFGGIVQQMGLAGQLQSNPLRALGNITCNNEQEVRGAIVRDIGQSFDAHRRDENGIPIFEDENGIPIKIDFYDPTGQTLIGSYSLVELSNLPLDQFQEVVGSNYQIQDGEGPGTYVVRVGEERGRVYMSSQQAGEYSPIYFQASGATPALDYTPGYEAGEVAQAILSKDFGTAAQMGIEGDVLQGRNLTGEMNADLNGDGTVDYIGIDLNNDGEIDRIERSDKLMNLFRGDLRLNGVVFDSTTWTAEISTDLEATRGAAIVVTARN